MVPLLRREDEAANICGSLRDQHGLLDVCDCNNDLRIKEVWENIHNNMHCYGHSSGLPYNDSAITYSDKLRRVEVAIFQ